MKLRLLVSVMKPLCLPISPSISPAQKLFSNISNSTVPVNIESQLLTPSAVIGEDRPTIVTKVFSFNISLQRFLRRGDHIHRAGAAPPLEDIRPENMNSFPPQPGSAGALPPPSHTNIFVVFLPPKKLVKQDEVPKDPDSDMAIASDLGCLPNHEDGRVCCRSSLGQQRSLYSLPQGRGLSRKELGAEGRSSFCLRRCLLPVLPCTWPEPYCSPIVLLLC